MSAPVAARQTRQDLDREVAIGSLQLSGHLRLPASAAALVIFAHGSGSSRFSPRNRAVARH
jgi:putative phosphoribosyl transferase